MNITLIRTVLEHISKDFQLSLVLCDRENALKYEQKYKNYIYEISRELAENINRQKYFDLFIDIFDGWRAMLSYDVQKVLVAMMLKNEISASRLKTLTTLLTSANFDLQSIVNEMLIAKNIEELDQLFLDYRVVDHMHANSRKLASIGMTTSNLEVAEKTLSHILDSREDLKARIQVNIIFIKADQNVHDALSYIDEYFNRDGWGYFNKHHAKFYRYRIALKIYSKDKDLALKIIKSLDYKYRCGFKAYLYAIEDNKVEILKLIEEAKSCEISYKYTYDDYYDAICNIAYNIVGKYPYLSIELKKYLYRSELALSTIETKIALALAKIDIDEALSFIMSLEEEVHQSMALLKLTRTIDEEQALYKVLSTVQLLKYADLKYEVLVALNKKIDVPLAVLESIAIELTPYSYWE